MKTILLTNLQCKSNNSFHRTNLRPMFVLRKDPGLTLNSKSPLVSPWVSKCSRQTGKIRFWKETKEIYRLTSRNISLLLFCDDFRNRRKNHTLWGGTKLYGLYKGVSLPRAPNMSLIALEQVFGLWAKLETRRFYSWLVPSRLYLKYLDVGFENRISSGGGTREPDFIVKDQ